MSDQMRWTPEASHMTDAQVEALDRLHRRYNVESWHPRDFWHTFDLPDGYVAGWVQRGTTRIIYVGVSPDGQVSS